MLKFNYKLTVKERVKAKCPRHPQYNPEKHGRERSSADAQRASTCMTC